MRTHDIRNAFKRRLQEKAIIVAPGVYDALSAALAEKVGFEALFYSGSALAYGSLGRPDISLLSMTEIAESVARTTDRTATPLIVDVDYGFGGAAHAGRCMSLLERAGAAVVQIEDQAEAKPSNDLTSRPLISTKAMISKISAMLDHRDDEACLIGARTDAARTSASEAIDRAASYLETGADLLFVEGLRDPKDIERLINTVGGQVPLIYNTIYTDVPSTAAAALESLGFRVALFPGLAQQGAARGMLQALSNLKDDPDLRGGAGSPLQDTSIPELLDCEQFLHRFR